MKTGSAPSQAVLRAKHWRYLMLVLLAIGGPLAGCHAPFARLQSVIVEGQSTASPQSVDVRIVRADSAVDPMLNMGLLKGDSISTSAGTRVVTIFRAGYEITLDTGTVIYIQNPSIFLRIGRAFIAFIRGAQRVQDTLDVQTPQAVLHDAGTQFLVAVDQAGTVSLTVVDGRVRASSRDGTWNPITYTARQEGLFRPRIRPEPLSELRPEEVDVRLGWVRAVRRVLTVPIRPQIQQLCTVPRITGLTETDARQRLKDSGFVGQAVSRLANANVDVVTAQREKPESRIQCGLTVHYAWGQYQIR